MLNHGLATLFCFYEILTGLGTSFATYNMYLLSYNIFKILVRLILGSPLDLMHLNLQVISLSISVASIWMLVYMWYFEYGSRYFLLLMIVFIPLSK